MPDDTTVRPLSEDYRPNVGDVVAVKGTVLSFERSPTPLGADLWRIEVADEIIYVWAGHRDGFAPWIDPATIAQRDALIEELRARVKELEDRVTSWEQDALRGSTGRAAWDWG